MFMVKNKEKTWYNNASMLTYILISLIFGIVILSQAFAVKNNIGAVNTFRNLFNHNTIYIFSLIYFIIINFKLGRKYFNIINLIYIILYGLLTIAAFLTIFQSFGIISLADLLLNTIMFFYMTYTFLSNTRLWKDLKLNNIPFDEVKNESYYYSVVVLSVIVMFVSLIGSFEVDGVILSILDFVYTILFARFIYLYKDYEDSNGKNKNMDDDQLFMLIDKERCEIPILDKQIKSVQKYHYNFYQIVAIITMIIGLFVGIVIGNVFPACEITGLYTSKCSVTKFNMALTIITWFSSFLLAMSIFFMGHVINILNDINKNIKRK